MSRQLLPKAVLSAKDQHFREFALHDNMWKVILYVGTPLALYQSLNQLFKIFDSMMAAHISAGSVSAVAYLSQISLMLSALGGGLAIGSSLKISEAYGAGDFDLVKKRVSTLFAMCSVLSRHSGFVSSLHTVVSPACQDAGGLHLGRHSVLPAGALRYGHQLL